MEIEILGQPMAACAKVTMSANEVLQCEPGAMIAMSSDVKMETTTRTRGKKGGGFFAGLKRMFAGESLFINQFTATGDGQDVVVAPKLVGDIASVKLEDSTLIVQGSSWLANGGEIDIDASFPGLVSGLFSGEGMVWVKCSGTGDLLINSFGGIYEVEVDGAYMVDTGHVVAYDEGLKFTINRATKSLIASWMSGEGFVSKFEGKGRVFCQTHDSSAFGAAIGGMLPPQGT